MLIGVVGALLGNESSCDVLRAVDAIHLLSGGAQVAASLFVHERIARTVVGATGSPTCWWPLLHRPFGLVQHGHDTVLDDLDQPTPARIGGGQSPPATRRLAPVT